jgi:hypothetical protein
MDPFSHVRSPTANGACITIAPNGRIRPQLPPFTLPFLAEIEALELTQRNPAARA